MFKFIWIFVCFAIPVGFLLIENATGIMALDIIKNFTTIMSLPFFFAGVVLVIQFLRVFRADEKAGLLDFEYDVKKNK